MNYAQIRSMDISDGIGIRVGLYVSGCNHHCRGCFNQEAQSFSYGKEFTDETFKSIVELMSPEYISGLSILGGDPMWQDDKGIETLIELCKITHELDKDVWIWTGFTWEEIFDSPVETSMQSLVLSCDYIVDGRFEEDKKDLTLKWRGSSNQRVIDVKETIKSRSVVTIA